MGGANFSVTVLIYVGIPLTTAYCKAGLRQVNDIVRFMNGVSNLIATPVRITAFICLAKGDLTAILSIAVFDFRSLEPVVYPRYCHLSAIFENL